MKWDRGAGLWLPDVRREPSLGLRKGKYERRLLTEIERIVIHHTGVGVLGRFQREKDRRGWKQPIESAIHIYTRIMCSSGHYVVDYDGSIIQCVPDDYCAWQAGYGGERRRKRLIDWYRKLRFNRRVPNGTPRWFSWRRGRYRWWADKWHVPYGLDSPVDWFPTLDVNRETIGIELLSVPGRDPFPGSQIHGGKGGIGLTGLVQVLANSYGIPIDRMHILTHSDAVPTARTTKSGQPYDPPPSKLSLEDVFGWSD